MSEETRLPSFNDFSPKILKGDLRLCLAEIAKHGPNDQAAIAGWAKLFFSGACNKRSTTNIPATLKSTGLATTQPLTLTSLGTDVLNAASPQEAARVFCKHQINKNNADTLLVAIKNLYERQERATKISLKNELQALGVTNLSTATTDHTTLRNWLVEADLVEKKKGGLFEPNDVELQKLLGFSGKSLGDLAGLSSDQKIMLLAIKKQSLDGLQTFKTSPIIRNCLTLFPGVFKEDQLRKDVFDPLEKNGWISTTGISVSGHGGKSGAVTVTKKLRSLPIRLIAPSWDQSVPGDLQSKINTPLSEIKRDLKSKNKHAKGVALELLALRMIIDLNLDPKGFRVRGASTGGAEVDLVAEGKNLVFSRWTIQCKNIEGRVGLNPVAKEVGIAVHSRAHVVAIISTSSFSKPAIDYAMEVTKSTHLQFVFIGGDEVEKYLNEGSTPLIEFVMQNAEQVMYQKSVQPNIAEEEFEASIDQLLSS